MATDLDAQAERWNARLRDGDMSEAERDELARWLQAAPEHERALEADENLSLLFRAALDPEGDDLTQATPTASRRWGDPRYWVPLAATLAAVSFVLWPLWAPPVTYTTSVGEQRAINLPDGSRLQLNTQSRVVWLGKSNDRRVALLAGEALFDIRQDSSHPFRIEVGESEIRVLGTQLDVYLRHDGSVKVSVLSGTIAISGLDGGVKTLRTADQLVYTAAGAVLAEVRDRGRVEQATTWLAHEMILDHTVRLTEVVDDLARYTRTQIRVDPTCKLADVHIAGTVDLTDVRGALLILQREGTFVLKEQGVALQLVCPAELSSSGAVSARHP